MYKNNSSGHTGLSWNRTKDAWMVRLTVDGKQKSFGTFKVYSEALDMVKSAQKMINNINKAKADFKASTEVPSFMLPLKKVPNFMKPSIRSHITTTHPDITKLPNGTHQATANGRSVIRATFDEAVIWCAVANL